MKRSWLGALFLLGIGTYHVLLLLVLDTYEQAFWLGYAFVWLALLCLIFTAFSLFKTGHVVFKYPLLRIALIHLLIALVLSTSFFLINPASFNIVFLPLFLNFVLCLCWYLLTMLGRFAIEGSLAHTAKKRANIHHLRQRIASKYCPSMDAQVRKQFERLDEAIAYSDPLSNKTTAVYDNALFEALDVFDVTVDVTLQLEWLQAMHTVLEQRNQAVKQGK